MKQKQLLILLILVVVLGAIGYVLRRNQQSTIATGGNPALGKKLFGELPINDVAQISIKHTTNELNLAKKENLWRVRERNDYPANYSDIHDFLIKAKDNTIVQVETLGA